MKLRGAVFAVTGAGGFIGSRLVAALQRAGARVHALDGPTDTMALRDVPGVWRWRADINDAEVLDAAFAGVDCVLHLAGPPSVADSLQRPEETARSHVLGTVQVLRACRRAGIGRLVYLSSAEVYGQPPNHMPVQEDAPLRARSPYAASKIAAEQFIASAVATDGLRAIVLRPFSVYGPGMSGMSLIGGLLRQVAADHALGVHDLRPVRDYVHVDDLVRAAVLACSVETATPLTLNIGSGRGSSVREVIAALGAALDRELVVSEHTAQRRSEGVEILALVADIDQARQHLDWQPQILLHEGLRRLMAQRLASAPKSSRAQHLGALPRTTEPEGVVR